MKRAPHAPAGVHLLRVKRSRSASSLAEAGEAEPPDEAMGAGAGEEEEEEKRAAVGPDEAAATVARLLGSCAAARAPRDIEDLAACLEVMHEQPTRRLPPVVPCYYPFRRRLEPGTVYRWCACGRSAAQPWCDSSCRPGDPESIAIVVERPTSLSLCGCKYSGGAPLCDGSHVHVHAGTEQQPQE